MGKYPKVSVIMSVYNSEKYLEEAINSVLNQTFQDFELIVIDDGSTDNSRRILESYRRHSKIKMLINKHNEGVAAARNKALKISKGKYIAVIDADDIALPQRLEKEVRYLDKHPEIGLVGSFYYVIDENGKILKLITVPTTNEEIQEILIKHNCFAHSSIMFRRECLDTVGGYREAFQYALDYDFILRISEKYKVAIIPEPLCAWRINPNSISVTRKICQDKYAQLAREFAIERRTQGKDRLQIMPSKKFLLQCDCITRKEMAKGYLFWGRFIYGCKKYKEAKKWAFKSIKYNLFEYEAWVLLIKIFVSALLPESALKELRSFKNSKAIKILCKMMRKTSPNANR